MADRIVNRIVFHIGGYDPMPPLKAYSRFARELRRFERTWSTTASVSEMTEETDQAVWTVITSGRNWRTETRFHWVRWDDVMAVYASRPFWWRLPFGLSAFAHFVAGGALWGYARTNWRYALFFLYPFVLIGLFGAAGWLAGDFVFRLSGSVPLGLIAGVATALLLLQGPGRWAHVPLALDDWIFSRAYVRGGDPALDGRLDRLAETIAEAAREAAADEILVIGHSLGAVMAIQLVDRTLQIEPDLIRMPPRVALVTIGSSILKIGLHRGAVRFRAALARVASTPGLFWAEYQALTDVMNFYKSDPVAASGLAPTGIPIVRIVRIRRMLDPAAYRRIRRNFYRVHCQFVSGNDRRAAYDYYMLLCGPLPAERQARLPDGPASQIEEDGTLLETERKDR